MAKQLDNSEYMGEDSTYRAIVSPDEQVTEIGIENGVPKFKKQDGTTEPFGTRVTRDGADIPSIPVGEPNGLCPIGTDGKIPKEFGGGESWTAFGTAEDNTPPSDLAVGGTFYKLFVPPPKFPILGVDQVGRQDPLNLPRTDGAVGMSYSLNPDGKTYSSDFDNVYPYSDITEVTDSKGNKFIRIPKFYHKFTTNSDGTLKVQISHDKINESWTTCFINNGVEIDYMDIGKYEASSNGGLASISGASPLADTISGFRSYAMANGNGYHQYDIWNYQVIQLLFLVEFATTNSQSIMQGVVGASGKVITGACDKLGSIVTGSVESVTDKTSACVYRGIENPWGNINKWVDGINFNSADVYVCDNISQYASDKFTTPYSKIGTRLDGSSGQFIKTMSNNNRILLPSVAGGSSNIHYCDSYEYNGGARVLFVGGAYFNQFYAGLWHWNGYYKSSHIEDTNGSRLCYKPI